MARSLSRPRCGGLTGACLIGLYLIVLHRSDGGDVTINADQITSLRSPAGRLDRLIPEGHCLVGLTDGKFVTVLEACAEVRRRLETRP